MPGPVVQGVQSTPARAAAQAAAPLQAPIPLLAEGTIKLVLMSSGTVLMLAWMNREAIEQTLSSGQVVYFSRSRQALWRKGETSGNSQALQSMHFDCDADAILLQVEQLGPACHTNRENCFYLRQLSGISVL